MKKLKCTPFTIALVVLILGLIISFMMKRREGAQNEYVQPNYSSVTQSPTDIVEDNRPSFSYTQPPDLILETKYTQPPDSILKTNYTQSPGWDGVTKPPSSVDTFSSWIKNMDISGKSYPNSPLTNVTLQQCQLTCKNDELCGAFVTDFQGARKKGNCWLKYKGGHKMAKDGFYLKVKN